VEFAQLVRGNGQFLNANKRALGFADFTVGMPALRLAA